MSVLACCLAIGYFGLAFGYWLNFVIFFGSNGLYYSCEMSCVLSNELCCQMGCVYIC